MKKRYNVPRMETIDLNSVHILMSSVPDYDGPLGAPALEEWDCELTER